MRSTPSRPVALPWVGDAPTQRSNDIDTLIPEARGSVRELNHIAQTVAERTGGDVYDRGARVKTLERVHEKKGEYGGRFDGILDLAAASVVYPTVAPAYEGARVLFEMMPGRVVRFRDRIKEPTKVGYADLVANVRLTNGHIVELQLHVAPMIEAKKAEQALFTMRRTIEASMAPNDQSKLNALNAAAVSVYGIARQCLNEQRDLTPGERSFIDALTNPGVYNS